jgi:ABC-type dipeptide/oligopeptide/nickel transport system permease component
LVIILVIVSVLVLALMRALPGGPIRMPVTGDQLTQMTPEQIDQLKQQLFRTRTSTISRGVQESRCGYAIVWEELDPTKVAA